MDWNELRHRWREAPAIPVPQTLERDVEARDRKLRATVRRRDLLETVVAALMAPMFAGLAVWLAWRGAWIAFGFCALIVAWIGYVPWRLKQARRALGEPRPDVTLVAYLRAQHEAMLAQARMLEQAWLWYVAPCMVGIGGLVLSLGGVTTKTVAYLGFVGAFGLVLGYANRRVARTEFRDHAAAIARQLERLDEEDPR